MTLRQPGPSAMRGFTLLEAIVAMTIFSMCALALFGWQSGSLRSLDRVAAHAQRADDVRLGLAFIRTVNPMQEPAGKRELGDAEVSWQATPVEPVRSGKTQVGLPSLFEVGLYNVAVVVQPRHAGPGGAAARFDVRLVGYRQARHTEFSE